MFGFKNKKEPCGAFDDAAMDGGFLSRSYCNCLWCDAVKRMHEGNDVSCQSFQVIAMKAKKLNAENEKLKKIYDNFIYGDGGLVEDMRKLEIEKQQLKAQLQQSQPERKPHKCPVCNGAGKKQIYDHVSGTFLIATPQCNSCNGTGVVWEQK